MTDFVVSTVTPEQLNKSHFYPFYPITAGFRDPVASTSTVTPNKIAD